MHHLAKNLAAIAGLTLLTTLVPAERSLAAANLPQYSISESIPLGLPDKWDYLTVDESSSRLYVAHGTGVDIFDAGSGAKLGNVPVGGANGVAVVPAMGKGYAGSRTDKSAVVFDLKTLKVLKKIPADEDTDAVIYDDFSKRVFIMDGDPHNIAVIDAEADKLVTKIALKGQPEFAATDGRGKLYVNLADARAIQRIDTKSATVDATWPIAECERPHGLSIDRKNNRLFATCVNEKIIALDASSGKILATLPIGPGSDASAFDSSRNLIFSSNGSGTLSIVHEADPDHFVKLGELPTQPLARTMALNSATGRIYLVAADRVEIDAQAKDPRKRYSIAPGSARLLFLDPR